MSILNPRLSKVGLAGCARGGSKSRSLGRRNLKWSKGRWWIWIWTMTCVVVWIWIRARRQSSISTKNRPKVQTYRKCIFLMSLEQGLDFVLFLCMCVLFGGGLPRCFVFDYFTNRLFFTNFLDNTYFGVLVSVFLFYFNHLLNHSLTRLLTLFVFFLTCEYKYKCSREYRYLIRWLGDSGNEQSASGQEVGGAQNGTTW